MATTFRGSVTRVNFSCKLERNVIKSITLLVAENMLHANQAKRL